MNSKGIATNKDRMSEQASGNLSRIEKGKKDV